MWKTKQFLQQDDARLEGAVTVVKHMENHKYGGEPIEKLNPENAEMIAAFSFEVWSYSVKTSRGTATAFNSRSGECK